MGREKIGTSQLKGPTNTTLTKRRLTKLGICGHHVDPI